MLTDEMKTKWTDALESGEYEQGRFHLKMDGKYCCLGVFCEVNDIPLYYNDEIINKGIDAGYSAINLYIDGSVVTKLMAMNDSQEKTFPKLQHGLRRTYNDCTISNYFLSSHVVLD